MAEGEVDGIKTEHGLCECDIDVETGEFIPESKKKKKIKKKKKKKKKEKRKKRKHSSATSDMELECASRKRKKCDSLVGETEKKDKKKRESSPVAQENNGNTLNCDEIDQDDTYKDEMDKNCGNSELPHEPNEDALANKGAQDLETNPLHSKWRMSKEELQTLRAKGIKVKMGQWTKKEIKTIEKNMEAYLKAHRLTDPSSLIFDKDDKLNGNPKMKTRRDNFYQTLANGIDRPLFHIYRRVLRMYDPTNHVGSWTKEDTEALLRYYSLYREQWTKIGKLLGRSGSSVHHRYLTLQKNMPGYRCKWTQDEEDRLNAAVRVVTGTEFSSQISKRISWVAVSEFVCTRTPDQCREKWLKGVCWVNARGETDKKWSALDDISLIERLYAAPIVDESDIDWVKLAKEIPNCPSYEWLRWKFLNLKKVAPNYIDVDFEETIGYLYDVHIPRLKEKLKKLKEKECCGDEENNVSTDVTPRHQGIPVVEKQR